MAREMIRQRIPGSNLNPPGFNQRLQALPHLRLHLQVVLNPDRLSIEGEILELRIRLHDLNQAVDRLHQHKPRFLKPVTVLPVPVGIANNMNSLRTHRGSNRMA